MIILSLEARQKNLQDAPPQKRDIKRIISHYTEKMEKCGKNVATLKMFREQVHLEKISIRKKFTDDIT